jgi:ubiquinol-cytochrome c reductase cytochrome c1 subunit
MHKMKKLLTALLFAPAVALAAGAAVHLDKAPDVQNDKAALQSGARTFVNYCLNCHGASFVRYNRLTELGLTEQQVKENLMFTADKIGERCGLPLVQRSRRCGSGRRHPTCRWLRAHARRRTAVAPTGCTLTCAPSMSTTSAPLAGTTPFSPTSACRMSCGSCRGSRYSTRSTNWNWPSPERFRLAEYDKVVGDLVGFMVWLAEPDAGFRKRVGFGVLAFLVVLFGFAYAMKKQFWKDIK